MCYTPENRRGGDFLSLCELFDVLLCTLFGISSRPIRRTTADKDKGRAHLD
jgi:hypothetical protein